MRGADDFALIKCESVKALKHVPFFFLFQDEVDEQGFHGDGNTDLCVLCGLGGSLLCCDGCPAAYHMRCIGETPKSIPAGEWLCAECSAGSRGKLLAHINALIYHKGARVLQNGSAGLAHHDLRLLR